MALLAKGYSSPSVVNSKSVHINHSECLTYTISRLTKCWGNRFLIVKFVLCVWWGKFLMAFIRPGGGSKKYLAGMWALRLQPASLKVGNSDTAEQASFDSSKSIGGKLRRLSLFLWP